MANGAAPAGAAIETRMGSTEWAMLVSLSLLWGGAFFFVGVAVKELPPLTVVALRVGLAAPVLWLLLPFLGNRAALFAPFRRLEVWGAFFGMAVLNNALPFALIAYGQTEIGSGLAAILNATMPIFTVLVAHALTRDEKLTALKLIGVVLGFLGVAVMIAPEALEAGLSGAVMGQLAVLAAALIYSFSAVFGRRFRRLGVPAVATATGQLTCSTLVLGAAALLVDDPLSLPVPSALALGAVLALALASTALAYLLYFNILERAGAVNVSLVTLLIPVSAVLLGALFLDERLGWPHAVGMGLIGLGLAAIDGRLFRRGASARGRRTRP